MKIKSIKKVILDEPKLYYDVINANPYNNFLIKTNSGYIGSHNCFFDEINFIPTLDRDKQVKKAKELVNTAAVRMLSRFMHGDYNPTLLCIASSKTTDLSFMETFIETKRRNESKTTLVIDEPQWVIREDKNSPIKFKVAVGNKYLNSEVLPLDVTESEVNNYINRGYLILDVPMGYHETFLDDLEKSLTDIAGIAVTNLSKYISGTRLNAIKKSNLVNPFTKDIIEVGNAPDDLALYYDFFDLNVVPTNLKYKPMFIHLDMSISGDKTGIAGVWIIGKKPHQDNVPDSKELYYLLAFSVAVKAPKGHLISFEKNRLFIYWLRDQGFNIKGISTDTFLSYDTGQALKNHGFNYDIVSVDRVSPKDRVCLPYQYFKSAIYEERIGMYESTLLTLEILGLERNNGTGKIDHPDGGKTGSKDVCDAFCGSVWNASLHAEEFAFDYGESLEVITDINVPDLDLNSISLDLEEMLRETSIAPLTKKLSLDYFLDFGMGKAHSLDNLMYESLGIFVF